MADTSRAELKYLVERQREEVKMLNEVGRLLSSTVDHQEIVRLVASYLHRAFPVALCSVLSLPQRKLHLVPFAPLAQIELAGAIRRIRESANGLLHRTLKEEESVTSLEESLLVTWMQPTISLRSQLLSPITVNGQPLGLLSLFSGQAEAFTKEDEHAVGIVADQLGAALRNAALVEELRKADELKNQMLSIVSHELSTPLTAIKEGVNLVLDGSLGETTPDQRDFLSTVVENSERLERLLQKVKTATELMTGQTQFEFESVDLRTLLQGIEKACQPLAKSRGVSVKLIEYPKPCFWQIDKGHVAQVLGELIENAIQATPQDGLVTLKLFTEATMAEIQVIDTGKGIAKEALPTLFDRFQSIGGIHERKMGGLGLGLFIAKALIEGHEGTIKVESTVGEGTWIAVRLPKRAEAAVTP